MRLNMMSDMCGIKSALSGLRRFPYIHGVGRCPTLTMFALSGRIKRLFHFRPERASFINIGHSSDETGRE